MASGGSISDFGNMSSDQKLDLLLSTVLETKSILVANTARLNAVEVRVDKQDQHLASLSRQVSELKDAVNVHDQKARSNTIRLLGFPMVPDEKDDPSILIKRIYDKIFVPIWTAAREKKALDAVPRFTTADISCFRLGARPAMRVMQPKSISQPLPIIVRFGPASSHLRLVLLRFKREFIPKPTEADRAAGSLRFIIAEDLTPACFRALKSLQDDDRVSGAWTVEGKIRLVMADDPSKTVRAVKSIFDNLDDMIFNAR